MAPSTVSQNRTQTSPPQESSIPVKRSLRSRSSNSTVISNSHQDPMTVAYEDKDGGGVGEEHNSEIVVAGGGGDHDARGASYPQRWQGTDDDREMDDFDETEFDVWCADSVVNGVEHRKRKRSPSTIAQESHHREKRGAVIKVKETAEQAQFKEWIAQIQTVLLPHDPTPTVLYCPLPAPSTETDDVPNAKRSKTEPSEVSTTIASKLSKHEYSTIAQIEDDLLAAAKHVLATLPPNTEPYIAVTSFFTYAQYLLLNRPSVSPEPKPAAHSLRSSAPNGTSASPPVPTVRPPLRQALYTIGQNGPLFTSLASRDTNPLLAPTLPPSITIPTATGGTFTASAASIVPTNVSHAPHSRKLVDVLRQSSTFPNRRRGDFSEDAFGKIQSTKWLDWGIYASFAPEWDDGGVGGGFGAEWMAVDWAYKKLRKQRRKQKEPAKEVVAVEQPKEEVIDENLLLQWEPEEVVPPKDLAEEADVQVDETEMSLDETLAGLRVMIKLLGQLQALRNALGNAIVPSDEQALAENIAITFQLLITGYNIPPKALLSQLPSNAYNLIHLSHPEYTGSLPPKAFSQWAPPPSIPQQRAMSYSHHPQSRPLPINTPQPQQRLAPGPSSVPGYPIPRGQPITPIQRGGYTPQAPAAYSTPAGGMYGTPTYRGVGRPRKYDIRR